jgi:hypothetical protein
MIRRDRIFRSEQTDERQSSRRDKNGSRRQPANTRPHQSTLPMEENENPTLEPIRTGSKIL